jgi:hypothetical protein
LLVELADSVAPFVVLVPRFVIVAGNVAERGQDAFQIVRILKTYVVFD